MVKRAALPREQASMQLSFSLYSAANRMIRLHKPFLQPLGLTFPQYLRFGRCSTMRRPRSAFLAPVSTWTREPSHRC